MTSNDVEEVKILMASRPKGHRGKDHEKPPHFTKEKFWKTMVACLCTTQQKSGPEGKVSNFLHEEPFPLCLAVCEERRNLQAYAEAEIGRAGLRFGPTIGERLEKNLVWLRNGGWKIVNEQFNILARLPDGRPEKCIPVERQAARIVMGQHGGLAGLGPKQARNLWKDLKLTQYEMPIDGRVAKWVKKKPIV